MMFASLVAMSMIVTSSMIATSSVVTVSTGPINAPDPTALKLTAREKDAAVRPLVERATECIAGRVAGDERYDSRMAKGKLGDLIVESVSPCIEPVRAMIDAYDRHYGEGSGEAFFMGPYLDMLPRAVTLRRQHDERRGKSSEAAAAPR